MAIVVYEVTEVQTIMSPCVSCDIHAFHRVFTLFECILFTLATCHGRRGGHHNDSSSGKNSNTKITIDILVKYDQGNDSSHDLQTLLVKLHGNCIRSFLIRLRMIAVAGTASTGIVREY